jgi:hypothetical protein
MANEEIDQFISESLAQIGERSGDIEAVFQVAADRWVVALKDERQVDVGLNELARRLYLSMEIGQPRPDDLQRVMRALLTYNLMWQEGDGTRAAMASDDGPASLIADIPLSDLSNVGMQSAIAALSRNAEIWRAFVEGEMTAQPDFEPSTHIRA